MCTHAVERGATARTALEAPCSQLTAAEETLRRLCHDLTIVRVGEAVEIGRLGAFGQGNPAII